MFHVRQTCTINLEAIVYIVYQIFDVLRETDGIKAGLKFFSCLQSAPIKYTVHYKPLYQNNFFVYSFE
jgi:hypothetical protein